MNWYNCSPWLIFHLYATPFQQHLKMEFISISWSVSTTLNYHALPVLPVSEVCNMGYSASWTLHDHDGIFYLEWYTYTPLINETEGTIKNRQSRETGKIGNTRYKTKTNKTKNTTQYVLYTTIRNQTQIA